MKIKKENAVKCYKVFNSDWTCRDFQYEVGKEYHMEGYIRSCERGFHACKKLSDCFNYYAFDPQNKVAQVELWGSVEEEGVKLCGSDIKIISEFTWYEVLNLCNSGNRNSGNRNSGNCNSGCRNSGDCNSGDCNSGYCNSGYWNSGYWNSGNRNSGYFNTPKQNKIFCFNKLTDNQDIIFPDFLFFDLTEWVHVCNMTDEEKATHPECDVIGGYLKAKEYKEAFRDSFLKAKKSVDWQKQLQLLKAIPNFDADIFYEISGIKPEELN